MCLYFLVTFKLLVSKVKHVVSAEAFTPFPSFSSSTLFSSSPQPQTHVRRMMDVVPARICVSLITTALRPAPVHTSWSSLPTSSRASVGHKPRPCLLFSPETRKQHINGRPFALGSSEKVPPVRAALWNPRRGHRRPVHEHHDGSHRARHRWCDGGGLRRHGGEDLLGRHQNSNHQTGLHQRHPVGDHHFCR